MLAFRGGFMTMVGLAVISLMSLLCRPCQGSPVSSGGGGSGGVPDGVGVLRLRKRPFLEANCRGSYAPHFDSLVHRLDRVCRECADMFPSMREFIQDGCHTECYRNEIFRDCLSASMTDTDEVDQMVGELSG